MFGKSLVAARDLPAGHTLSDEDMALKKPGTGIPAARLVEIIGRRLKRPLPPTRFCGRRTLTEKRRRKICVVLVDRANYGRLKPVMKAIQRQSGLELQVLATGTMVLERFNQPVNVVRGDGFNIDGEIYIELEGSTPTTMAKSVGFGLVEFASEFHRLKPDVVLLIGDRYEALAAAIAAAYMNITLVHIQGGEGQRLDRRESPDTPSANSLISIFPRPIAPPNTWFAWGAPRHDPGNRLSQQRHRQRFGSQTGTGHRQLPRRRASRSTSPNRFCWSSSIRRRPSTAANGGRWKS